MTCSRGKPESSVELSFEVVGDQLPCVTDVVDHASACLVRVPFLNRFEDSVVLFHVLLEQARAAAKRGPREPAREGTVEVLDDASQSLVPGRFLDHAVEEVVRTRPLAVRVLGATRGNAAGNELRDRTTEEALRRMQLLELGVVDPHRGKRGGEPFELGADLVGLPDLTRGRAAHDRATVRLHLDDPAGLELAQGLANGRPADTELGREALLPQARADGDLAAEHTRADRRGEVIDKRLGTHVAAVGLDGHGPPTLARGIHLTLDWIQSRVRVSALAAWAARSPDARNPR